MIQFCAKAFSLYVDATAVQQIFGGTLQTLRGIKYLFKYVDSSMSPVCPFFGLVS